MEKREKSHDQLLHNISYISRQLLLTEVVFTPVSTCSGSISVSQIVPPLFFHVFVCA